MADCSYARCLQERKFIKRELQRWTKGMVYIVGLERVAEELMGRRKWKLYQEVIARSNHPNIINSTNLLQQDSSVVNNNGFQQTQLEQSQQDIINQDEKSLTREEKEKITLSQKILENHLKEENIATIKCKQIDIKKEVDLIETEHSEYLDSNISKNIAKVEPNTIDEIKISSSNNNSITNILIKEDEKPQPSEEENQNKIEKDRSENIEKEEDISKVNIKKEDLNLIEENNLKDQIPVDWKPQKECYFCVDGKLLTVNEKGELVAESGPSARPEADVGNTSHHGSDSDSSESGSEGDSNNRRDIPSNPGVLQTPPGNKTLESLLRGNMTSFESMAATLQAVATLQSVPGLSSFYPGLFYPQLVQQLPQSSGSNETTQSNTPVAPIAKPETSSPNETSTSTEQPLDLSAKATTPTFPASDNRLLLQNVSRIKSRVSNVGGRRSYTEDELQRALQDIISGKLGTRRAAVLYGIPRSTLRNKVYKLAMEQKREEELLLKKPIEEDDEEKEITSDGDDDNKERISSTPSQTTTSSQSLQKNFVNKESEKLTSQPSPSLQNQSHTPPNAWLDPNFMLQSLLLGGISGVSGMSGFVPPKTEDISALPEFFKNLLFQQELLKNAVNAGHQQQQQQQQHLPTNTENTLNGKPNPATDSRYLSFLQQQQQYLLNQQQNMNRKSETPETVSSADVNESDDSAVILKIPSFNSVVGGQTSTVSSASSLKTPIGKLNNSTSENLLNSPQIQTPHGSNSNSTTPILQPSPPAHLIGTPGLSPTIKRSNSESQSPPVQPKSLSIHDVIARSISQSFKLQQSPELSHQHHLSHQANTNLGDSMDPFKRAPQISVIKNLGDMTRFGGGANLMSQNPLNNSLTGTGGKGTRPKRGKYRNYDRDSLVEAVKAVQRGEMSVHRAGSYYGVPHSTLEYKVKERHLMRPRKREPKPQPLDDRTSNSSSSSIVKPSDLGGASGTLRTLDKSKILPPNKPQLKTPPFPSTSPNGLKMSVFDPTVAAQLQYAPNLFWPHPPSFSGLPMDFARSQQTTSTSPFPANAEQFFASQMMQKFQEEQTRSQLTKQSPVNQIKSARELAESLYDGNNANGSLLDGIIRQSLDRGKNELTVPHGALLDQLVKTQRSNSIASDDTNNSGHALKRPGSPMNFSNIEIKKERSSPTNSITSSERDSPVDQNLHNIHLQHHQHQVQSNQNIDSVENLIKIRDGLTLHPNNIKEELNGNSSLMVNNQSDNDDST